MSIGRQVVDGHNAAPVVQVLIWLCLCFSVLSVGAQLATKQALSRKLGAGDAVLLVALILCTAQFATLLSLAGQRLGQSSADLPQDGVYHALQALYGSEILNIFALVATKSAVFIALRVITPKKSHRITIHAAGLITILWGISAIFAIAFQCSAPDRWNLLDRSKCVDVTAIRTYNAVMNILTDAALVVIPSIIVLPVQMSWGKRFTILGGFWTRLLAIGASIVQIVFIRQLFTTDEDFLYGVYREVISMELVQTVGIMTACVPFLKPFLMSLESGFLRADDVNRQLTITTKNSSKQASTNRYIEIQKQRNLHSKVSLVHTQVPVNGEGQA